MIWPCIYQFVLHFTQETNKIPQLVREVTQLSCVCLWETVRNRWRIRSSRGERGLNGSKASPVVDGYTLLGQGRRRGRGSPYPMLRSQS